MRGVPGAEEAVEAGGIPYWKARTGKEVDFLIGGCGAPDAIQACHDMADPETMGGEVDAPAMCLDELRIPTGRIITMNAAGVRGPRDEAIVDALERPRKGGPMKDAP